MSPVRTAKVSSFAGRNGDYAATRTTLLLFAAPFSARVSARAARVDQQVTGPEKRMRGAACPSRFGGLPGRLLDPRFGIAVYGELRTTWTARCQASAGVVCGNSCVNSRTKSRLVCPPLRQRLRRTVRVPVDIIPHRLRKISLAGIDRSAARGHESLCGASAVFSELSHAEWKPGRITSSGPRRGKRNHSPSGPMFLVRSVGSGDQP